MTVNTAPRYARKEIREEAKRLVGQGWEESGRDADDHHVFIWPATGAALKLPQTPRGPGWRHRARKEAAKAMGVKPEIKRRHGGGCASSSGFNLRAAARQQQRRGSERARQEAREFAWQLELAELREAHEHANRTYDSAQTAEQRKAAERCIQRINRDIKQLMAARSAA